MRELPVPLFSDDSEDNGLEKEFATVIEDCTQDPRTSTFIKTRLVALDSHHVVEEGSEEQVAKLKELVRRLDIFRRSLAKELFYVLYLVSLEHEKVTRVAS